MAYIRKQPNGKYRVEIKHASKFIQNKTFLSEDAANTWAINTEKNIEKILSLKPKKLSNLTPEKIDTLGGIDSRSWGLRHQQRTLMPICLHQ